MSVTGQDTLKTRRTLNVGGKEYDYFSLEAAEAAGLGDVSRLPGSLKVLLENLLRYEDGRTVTVDDAKALAGWLDLNDPRFFGTSNPRRSRHLARNRRRGERASDQRRRQLLSGPQIPGARRSL